MTKTFTRHQVKTFNRHQVKTFTRHHVRTYALLMKVKALNTFSLREERGLFTAEAMINPTDIITILSFIQTDRMRGGD